MRPRVAVVLFNLGGPDRPEAIRPFLINIFRDPAILRVPFFVRPFLARRIAAARLEPARAAYATLGGRSPLLELTRAQAAALEAELTEFDAKCFIAMRYWHPLSDETAAAVRDWQPDEIVLLPLYPQYSTTTTGSSLTAWREGAARVGLVARTSVLCCYPTDAEYIGATTSLLRIAWQEARAQLATTVGLRVLFSAHGLPEAIVQAGDPYQWQIEQTVASILAEWEQEVDWAICYQSRATPQRWIEPSTEQEIERAAHDKVAVLVVPVAFVSEHSETSGGTRCGLPKAGRSARCARILPCPDAEFRCGFHRGVGEPGAAHTRPRPRIVRASRRADLSRRSKSVSVAMTIGFLTTLYPWTKAFHIISVIAWMAGMLYLPRLYVYHCEVKPGSAESERFKVMERRLLKQIINPAMIATWTLGVLLVLTPGIIHWSAGWWYVKLAMVLLLSGFHGALSRWRRDFLEDHNTRPQRFYRIANEAPTLLMVVIVVMVIVRPF